MSDEEDERRRERAVKMIKAAGVEGPSWSPEQRLWFEVLRCALADMHNPDRFVQDDGRRDIAKRAYKWFLDDQFEVGAYRYVCEALGFPHRELRRGFLGLLKKGSIISVKKNQIESSAKNPGD